MQRSKTVGKYREIDGKQAPKAPGCRSGQKSLFFARDTFAEKSQLRGEKIVVFTREFVQLMIEKCRDCHKNVHFNVVCSDDRYCGGCYHKGRKELSYLELPLPFCPFTCALLRQRFSIRKLRCKGEFCIYECTVAWN